MHLSARIPVSLQLGLRNTDLDGLGEHIPDVCYLAPRNTAMAVVSRAPIGKISAWKEKLGWKFPWCSSNGSDFSYDFCGTSADGADQTNLTVFKLNYKYEET